MNVIKIRRAPEEEPVSSHRVGEWLRGAVINRDRNLRMQYLAGLGLDLDDSAAIYAGLLSFRRFPEDLFTSAEGRVDSLRSLMLRRQ